MERPKVGVVLGSGTSRGIAHLGVLKALERNNIPIDIITGSSVGAIVGGCYATGIGVDRLEEIACQMTRRKLASLVDPAFSKTGIVDGKRIEQFLKQIIGDATFDELKVQCAVSATDICTGKAVALTEGSVVRAMRASISMSGIFVPVKHHDTFLVDGGIADPIPVALATKLGADILIAVIATRDVEKYTELARVRKRKKTDYPPGDSSIRNKFLEFVNKRPSGANWIVDYMRDTFFKVKESDTWTPNIVDILLQTIYIMEERVAQSQLAEVPADIVITPHIHHVQMLEFHRGKELIELGEQAVEECLPKIRDVLQKKGLFVSVLSS